MADYRPRGGTVNQDFGGRGGGGYTRGGSTRGAAFSGSQPFDRDENDRQRREPRQESYGAPNRNEFDNGRSSRGGDQNGDGPRGGGGYTRGGNARGAAFSGSQPFDRDENDRQRREPRQESYGAPTRGGRNPGGFDNQTNGNEFCRDQRSNGFDNDRPNRDGFDNNRGSRPREGASNQDFGGRGGGNGYTRGGSARGAAFSGSQPFDRDENDRQRREPRQESYGAPTRGGRNPGGLDNQTNGNEFRRDQRSNGFDNDRPNRDGFDNSRGSRPREGASNQDFGGIGGGSGYTRGGSARGAAFSGSQPFDRDENDRQRREPRQENYGAPTRGGRNPGGFDNQTSANEFRRDQRSNGFDNRDEFNNGRSSRGGDGPRGGGSGGYSRGGGNFARGSDFSGNQPFGRDENDRQRREQHQDTFGAPTRGTTHNYGNRGDTFGAPTRGTTHNYGNRGNSSFNDEFRRDERSNGNDYTRSNFGPPRGGGGSFSSGRNAGGGGRYEDRRGDENASKGYGGIGGYSGYGQFEDGRKEFTEENHAPRDFKPTERNVDEIFNEDKEDVQKNNATIFDDDADVLIEETTEQLHCDNWKEMNLHETLMANIVASDYIRPRKIQQKTIPYVLEGFDVKCQGETGSGKTAAFLIPIIQKLIEQSHEGQLPRSNPICLIIAPTRELVAQIFDQARKFCNKTGITVARAYGEYAVRQNLADIRNGCNILCACIGRLMQFVRNGDVQLRDVKYLVLDEADRLLMDNFNSDVLQLFQWPEMPNVEDRQTLLFSATLQDPVVMDLIKDYIKKKCVLITVKCQSNKRVHYTVFAVPNNASKFKYLVKYMKRITEENGGVVPRTLIFVNRKLNTDRVAIECTSNKFPATTIHGDRGQHLREEALASFRSGKTRCLVATDVCARGVDIKDMDHVINYDLPSEKDNFVQRCGRTGRVKNGIAMSFYLEDEDRGLASLIATVIQQNGQEAPGFLNGIVSSTDYNFGEGETQEEQPSSYGNTDENRSRSNSAVPPYHADASAARSRQETPQPTEINDITGDDGWD